MTKSRPDNHRPPAGPVSGVPPKPSMAAGADSLKSSDFQTSRLRQGSFVNVNKVKQQIMQEVAQSMTGQGKVQIFDDFGNDVTPVSLIPANKKKVTGPGASNGTIETGSSGKLGGGSKSTVASSFANSDIVSNFEHMSLPHNKTKGDSMIKSFSEANNASSLGIGSRSEFGGSFDDFQEARNMVLNDNTDRKDGGGVGVSTEARVLTDKELSKHVKIILQETEDVWLIDIPGSYVPNDSLEEQQVKAANARYQSILDARSRAENLVDRGMQTLVDTQKNKDTQASGRKRISSETQCTDWQIYDEVVATKNITENNDGQAGADSNPNVDPNVNSSIGATSESLGNNSQSVFTLTGSSAIGSRKRMNAAAREEEEMRDIYANIDDPGPMANQQTAKIGANGSNSEGSNSGMASSTGPADSFFNTHEGSNLNSSVLSQNRQMASPGVILTTIKETPKLSSLDVNSLMESVRMMENVMVENNYTKNHFSYRGIDKSNDDHFVIPDNNAKSSETAASAAQKNGTESQISGESDMDHLASQMPSLTLLYTLRTEGTRSRNVSCISYNHRDPNILAVSYGSAPGMNVPGTTVGGGAGTATSNVTGGLVGAANAVSAASKLRGLVLCWSLKNVEHPERVFKSESEANCVDFATSNPYLLAVGMNDGRIALYDVRSNEDEFVVDNSETGGKHHDAVWDVRWIERERMGGTDESSKRESLISISLDSRVCQWVLRKGLEYSDLLSLRRVTKGSQGQGGGASAAAAANSGSFLSRQTGGLCFDFHPSDKSIYLAGTEDGAIHRCSCSYNEQYLDSYFGHTAAVLKVKWSPFLEGVFLSCSADWTIRLWKVEQENCLIKFQSGHDVITDISWSPLASTVFAAVTKDGRIELWDLSITTLDPVINHSILDRKLCSVAFGPHAPVILTGDDYGNVNVYRLHRIFNKLIDTSKLTAKEERDWRMQEAHHLKFILENKNNNNNSTNSNNSNSNGNSDGNSSSNGNGNSNGNSNDVDPPTISVPEN